MKARCQYFASRLVFAQIALLSVGACGYPRTTAETCWNTSILRVQIGNSVLNVPASARPMPHSGTAGTIDPVYPAHFEGQPRLIVCQNKDNVPLKTRSLKVEPKDLDRSGEKGSIVKNVLIERGIDSRPIGRPNGSIASEDQVDTREDADGTRFYVYRDGQLGNATVFCLPRHDYMPRNQPKACIARYSVGDLSIGAVMQEKSDDRQLYYQDMVSIKHIIGKWLVKQ